MEEISDIVVEPVFPFFRHFSTQGIVPRIITAEPDIVTLEYVEGPRLGEVLRRGASLDTLLPLYAQLGTNVAHINKYCVHHGHLHTDNVIVHGHVPVVIDWGQSSYLGIGDIDFWRGQDFRMLLDATKDDVDRAGKEEFFGPLERAYRSAFEEEFVAPKPVSPRELALAAIAQFGF